MKTDAEIRRDVESELQWDPSIDDKGIGVVVTNREFFPKSLM